MLTRSPGMLVPLILAERSAEASFKLLVQLSAMQLRAAIHEAAIHENVSIIATCESGRFFFVVARSVQVESVPGSLQAATFVHSFDN